MLLDTAGLFAYLDDRDVNHADAVACFSVATLLLTHDYIMAELIALLHARGVDRARSLDFHQALLDSPEVEVVWVDEALHRAAAALLRERMDKSYSLADAVSFVLMRSRGETEALTTDRHFEQEGFVRLLRK